MVEGGEAAGKEAAKVAEGIIAKVARDALREADDVAKVAEKGAAKAAEKDAGRSATQLGDQVSRGTIDESESVFSGPERKVADRLADEGHDVKALKPSAELGVRTADALVNGIPTEFKTIETVTPNSTKIMRVLDDAARRGGQAREIVIDAVKTPLTREKALHGVERFKGLGKSSYDRITIWGDGWSVVGP